MSKAQAIALILFLGAFGFFLHGAAPSMTVGDSGELITAGDTLSLPHSPGYPTYMLGAKAVSVLIPWGNPGYRINLLSVICAVLSGVLVFVMSFGFLKRWDSALFGTLLFMQARAVVGIGSVSEVFALHTLLVVFLCWTVLRRQWAVSALALGLGLGNHQTLILVVPGMILWFLYWFRSERNAMGLTGDHLFTDFLKEIWSLVLFFLLGFSIYLVLLIRASREPFLNWGHPDSLYRLWRVLSRADYGSFTLALGQTPERTPETILAQFIRFFQGLSQQVTWAGVVAGVVGLFACLRMFKKEFAVLFLAFFLTGPFFFVFGNLPFDAQSTGVMERFLVVPTMLWCIFAGTAVFALNMRWNGLGWVLLGLPIVFLTQRLPAGAMTHRWDLAAYSYGRNNLRTMPPRSVLFMDGGDDTFYSLSYLTAVEHRRPDLTLHDRGGLVFRSPYGSDFRGLTREEKETRRQQVERDYVVSGAKPVYYSTMNDHILSDTPLIQQGILYRACPLKVTPSVDAGWAFYDYRGIAPWDWEARSPAADYRVRALIPFYPYQRAIQAGRAGGWITAERFSRFSEKVGPDVIWLKPNLFYVVHLWAYNAYQRGDRRLARMYYEDLIGWNPDDRTAKNNLHLIDQELQRRPG